MTRSRMTGPGTKPAKWTPEEDALLREHYVERGTDYLLTVLARTRKAIGVRAQALGLRRVELWTDEHMAVLREHYTANGAKFVAALVGRSETAVRSKAIDMQIRADKSAAGKRRMSSTRAVNAKKQAFKARNPKTAPKVIARKEWVGEADLSRAKITVAPPFVDRRFQPAGELQRVVDAAECREWARAAA